MVTSRLVFSGQLLPLSGKLLRPIKQHPTPLMANVGFWTHLENLPKIDEISTPSQDPPNPLKVDPGWHKWSTDLQNSSKTEPKVMPKVT